MNILISNKNEIKEIIKTYPPNFKGFKEDKLFYIISVIYTGNFYKDEKEEIDSGVFICAKIFNKLIGNNYKNYIDYLKENDIIFLNANYSRKSAQTRPPFPC